MCVCVYLVVQLWTHERHGRVSFKASHCSFLHPSIDTGGREGGREREKILTKRG